MSIAYLLFGFLFAAGAGTAAFLNGSGLLMALVAYGATGALAIIIPLAIQLVLDTEEDADWANAVNNSLSA